ncbi:50S ribosomal protein L15 [Candidatus Shapirobacteria bacterium]|nr:50S ribosomal protein L15 [Candidatus Shapirobacteria bacterium]
MINLNSLPVTKIKRRLKRVGRGYGSGKGGHTCGRGSKGHKARGKVKLTFDGGKIKKSWLKRLPLWRGKGKLKARKEALVINLDQLNKHYQNEEKVDLASLKKKNLIDSEKTKVKILGTGKLEKKLIVDLPCSAKAAGKIIKAGGRISK